MKLKSSVLLAFSVASVALAASYSSVNITLKQEMGGMRIGGDKDVSPVLGARNPTVKNGVAYVSASHSMGDWAVALSPRLPINLNLQLDQGDARLDLRSLKLSGLQVNQSQGAMELLLPAADLNATLTQTQGGVTLILPPDTGISLDVKKFSQGSLIMGGKTVAEGQEFNGTYQSANFDTARYRVKMTVTKEAGNLTVK